MDEETQILGNGDTPGNQTWELLRKIKSFYDLSETDEDKLHQINSAVSVLTSLRIFYEQKREIVKEMELSGSITSKESERRENSK